MPLKSIFGQPGISTIRSPRDVLNILSGLGTEHKIHLEGFAKLKQVDAQKLEGELSEKLLDKS